VLWIELIGKRRRWAGKRFISQEENGEGFALLAPPLSPSYLPHIQVV